MLKPLSHFSLSIAATSLVLAISVSTGHPTGASATEKEWKFEFPGSVASYGEHGTLNMDSMEYRIAQRLQKRIHKQYRTYHSLSQLTTAVSQRQKLLASNVHLIVFAGDDELTFDISAQKYPYIVKPTISPLTLQYTIDHEAISHLLDQELVSSIPSPKNATVRAIHWSTDPRTASKVKVDGIAQSGYELDTVLLTYQVKDALIHNTSTIFAEAKYTEGKILNETSEDLGEMRLWASGISDFTGSSINRQANVEKALSEHVHNTIVAPGESFSFNATLQGSVDVDNGWKMAKVIVNGGDLELQPGGGICQASTTAFRAALYAGFPIEERRSHSLYVEYYKKYGVGIDATIYPGVQDFVFRNDSDHPIILQAYNTGNEAHVSIFGTPDGREVVVAGPYFSATAPSGKYIAWNEILWTQTVQYANGEIRKYDVGSRYKTMPQTLAREFAPDTVLYSAAPTVLELAKQ